MRRPRVACDGVEAARRRQRRHRVRRGRAAWCTWVLAAQWSTETWRHGSSGIEAGAAAEGPAARVARHKQRGDGREGGREREAGGEAESAGWAAGEVAA